VEPTTLLLTVLEWLMLLAGAVLRFRGREIK
jgi:hypothetical protein